MVALHLLWIIPLFLVVFVGFWCLIVKMLSLFGWQPLAAQYRAASEPGFRGRINIGRAWLGGVSYQGSMEAGVLEEGLSLTVSSLFSVGHPPLLIPWTAIAPVRAEKDFWATSYSTTIRTGNGGGVSFRFIDEKLAAAMQSKLSAE